ncbi:hypothetical protein ACQ643_000549 [Escherichia coli]|uniref:hypothetical protein n=1 Tax=Escherichia coli TaxID=562 RepID=UPI0013003038|nr:hypothetical protein [Escherichia coli]
MSTSTQGNVDTPHILSDTPLHGAQNTFAIAETAPSVMRIFYVYDIENSMVGRAANKTPEKEICPPSIAGFERPTTLSKGVKSKYAIGHKT